MLPNTILFTLMHVRNVIQPLAACIMATVLLAAFGLPQPVQAQQAYWQQQVNYVIDVSLNDTEHTLDGFEKINYTNHSPDTLRFLWFHLWPNAYRNDKTAFSEQMLVNNRTAFYFSNQEQKGYINRLDFKVNGITATTQDHPQHIDIVKLLLPDPLPPRQTITISTPFHVKLPFNFSRGGHVKQAYQVTQWYPKPAVYDWEGWHPMPYLDQGEFYSEFGDYDVRITVPESYLIAATGELQNPDEIAWLNQKAAVAPTLPANPVKAGKRRPAALHVKPITKPVMVAPVVSTQTKTLWYLQPHVHDFAWFADRRFIVDHDTLSLPSGRLINAYSFYLPSGAPLWKNSMGYLKNAITTHSEWLGEYPFNTVTAVEAEIGFGGGMEYPSITAISPVRSAAELDKTIAHEVGHNWLYGILATNERTYPWMDEGMNTFYDWRYTDWQNQRKPNRTGILTGQAATITEKQESQFFETLAGLHKDQPINTPSQHFTAANYGLVAYFKAALWMRQLEALLGRTLFDSCMHAYYLQWQFRHPGPSNFKQVVESVSGRNLDSLFALLDQKGSLKPAAAKKIQVAGMTQLKDPDHNRYIRIAPAAGANLFDGLMLGGVIHNYQLPLPRLQFLAIPLYAFKSKRLNGLVRVSYNWYPTRSIYRVDAGVGAATFSMNAFQPQKGQKLFLRFQKLAPFVKMVLPEGNPLSRRERFIQLKTFFIREDALRFSKVILGTDTTDVAGIVPAGRVLHQLKLVIRDTRILYPYQGEWQIEQQKGFVRAAFTGNYFFNYANGQGGMHARLFAGKFFYTGAKTIIKRFITDRYHLNLTGANGYEDYTYSYYFAGRNKFEGWGSQQIMMRDGGFKVRTDLLSSKTGKTDDWLLAGNFSTGIPHHLNPLEILPVKIPLKVFADIGTFAEAWQKEAATNKFLFDAGIGISLFKETVNIYVPVIYSTVFRDYFRSSLGAHRFWKTISFSIDIRDFSLRKIDPNLPF